MVKPGYAFEPRISPPLHANKYSEAIYNNNTCRHEQKTPSVQDTGNILDDTNNITIGARFQIGFLGDPEYNFQHLIQGFPRGAHLSIQFSNNNMNRGSVNKKFNKGVDLFMIDLANRKDLGYVTGVIPNLSLMMFKDRLIHPELNIGIGIAYANKPHHHITNYKNTIIGSHINAAISGRLHFHIALAKNWHWQTGVSVLHVSNGNITIPNDGMNLISLESGLSYNIFKTPLKKHRIKHPESVSEQHFYLTSAVSLTDYQEGVQPGYNYYTLMAEWVKPLNEVVGFGMGIDFTHNNADMEKIAYQMELPLEQNQVGLKAISSLSLNKLTFMLQVGMINREKISLYNWVIFRHMVYKKMFLNISYRSYGFNGGHLSGGIGIKL